MKKRSVAIALLVAIAGGALALSLGGKRAEPGSPTALALGEAPLAALCRIRGEFRALPEPVYTGFHRHEAWEESRVGAPRVRHGPFWEIKLVPDAQAFVHAHSRLELVAALAPYTRDPARATKAMAIMAGLPVPTRAALYDTHGWAARLAEGPRRDPKAAITWDEAQLDAVAVGGMHPWGAAHAHGRRDGTHKAPANTLESELVKLLDQWEAVAASRDAAQLRALGERHARAWLVNAAYPYAEGAHNASAPAMERLLRITQGAPLKVRPDESIAAMRGLTREALAACAGA